MVKQNLKELQTVENFSQEKTAQHELLNFFDYAIKDSFDDLALLASRIREHLPEGKRMAFVSGNFNVVHPGHFRLLNFAAECADFLVVGICDDNQAGVFISQALRLESVRSIECVDLALPLSVPLEKFIAHLKPDIVVKGSEHQQHFNPEQAIVEAYGGKLLFSSGEMRFSSLDLLRSDMQEVMYSSIKKPVDYLHRHAIQASALPNIVRRFADLSIVVLGDLIIDEYITCDPLGISKEDPTIVVTPLKKDIFVGGAGIVAAHAQSLGANVHYFTVVGKDEAAAYAGEKLKQFGINLCLLEDISRPTTLKQRYRAEGKTLLRVSHLRHHAIEKALVKKMLKPLAKAIKNADLVVFSDFNYGCLPQELVDEVITLCQAQGVAMVADSQSSSQIGDVSRFHDMLLITPTEHEARLAVRDQASGLSMLADHLSRKANAKHTFITLGAEGLLVYSPSVNKNEMSMDQLPAFNSAPKDVSGGGDTLLITSSLALAAGASIWESAYLGSVAAACHVARIGNLPLTADELLRELYT